MLSRCMRLCGCDVSGTPAPPTRNIRSLSRTGMPLPCQHEDGIIISRRSIYTCTRPCVSIHLTHAYMSNTGNRAEQMKSSALGTCSNMLHFRCSAQDVRIWHGAGHLAASQRAGTGEHLLSQRRTTWPNPPTRSQDQPRRSGSPGLWKNGVSCTLVTSRTSPSNNHTCAKSGFLGKVEFIFILTVYNFCRNLLKPTVSTSSLTNLCDSETPPCEHAGNSHAERSRDNRMSPV